MIAAIRPRFIFVFFLLASSSELIDSAPSSEFGCPLSDATYTDIKELQLHRAIFVDPGALLNRIERALCEVCHRKENNPVATVCQEYICSGKTGWDPKRANCYLATGNWDPNTCANVPFRYLAHSISAYALNGSVLDFTFECIHKTCWPVGINDTERSNDGIQTVAIIVSVPNSWFIQTAVELNMAINDLPAYVQNELKLTSDSSPPYPSIIQVFDELNVKKSVDFIRATTCRWPLQPVPGSEQDPIAGLPAPPPSSVSAILSAAADAADNIAVAGSEITPILYDMTVASSEVIVSAITTVFEVNTTSVEEYRQKQDVMWAKWEKEKRESELKEREELFNKMDTKRGFGLRRTRGLSQDELRTVLQDIGEYKDEADLKTLFRDMDADDNGHISFAEADAHEDKTTALSDVVPLTMQTSEAALGAVMTAVVLISPR
jgi:Ca2+-binding EF-hand superfamily protein